jgi:hypothetical protein
MQVLTRTSPICKKKKHENGLAAICSSLQIFLEGKNGSNIISAQRQQDCLLHAEMLRLSATKNRISTSY